MNDQNELEALKKDLTKFVESRSLKAVRITLNLIKAKVSIEKYCEIVVEQLQKDPQFFTVGIRLAPTIIDNVFKNHCLFEGEGFLDKFRGKVNIKKAYISGKFYLTNYRLWTIERLEYPGTYYSRGIFGLIDRLIHSTIASTRKSFAKLAVKSLSDNLTILEWGYSLPFFNATNIMKTKKYISYSLSVEVKDKQKTIEIKITPQLKIARDSIFSQIEKSLLDNQ